MGTPDDLGRPIAYTALPEGVSCFDASGERIGVVVHVLADYEDDIFDGLVLETSDGARFADAPQVGDLHERGAVLKVSAADLHEPAENAAAMEATADTTEGRLTRRLHRAWDYLSGNY